MSVSQLLQSQPWFCNHLSTQLFFCLKSLSLSGFLMAVLHLHMFYPAVVKSKFSYALPEIPYFYDLEKPGTFGCPERKFSGHRDRYFWKPYNRDYPAKIGTKGVSKHNPCVDNSCVSFWTCLYNFHKHIVAWAGRVILNGEKVRVWKELVFFCFKELWQYLFWQMSCVIEVLCMPNNPADFQVCFFRPALFCA